LASVPIVGAKAKKNAFAGAPASTSKIAVYGEHEGVENPQVLYLSNVAFSKIGLPTLGSTSLGHYATKVTAVILQVALWADSGGRPARVVIKKNWNRHGGGERCPRERNGASRTAMSNAI